MRAALAIATTFLAICGCGGGVGSAGNEGAKAGAEGNPPAQAPAQPPANISISTPEARAEIRSGGAAIANWPAGVPAYPGAQANQNVNLTTGEAGQGGSILGFRTADTPQQVIAFYAREVVRNGYSVANQMDMGATATLTARRGQGQALNITAHRAGEVTQVQIVAPGP